VANRRRKARKKCDDAGHDLALQRDAATTTRLIDGWLVI
jgi:hypothetical protein